MGCISTAGLGHDGIISGLSDLILRPNRTCEYLREEYGLTYLPLVDDPGEAGMEFEEHWVPVDEDTLLHVWYMPADLDRGTIVYSCGNTGPMTCYLFAAELLTDLGWSVVMYDYEGFGESGGAASLGTLARDLSAVVDWTRAYTGRDAVTLMGISLGTIPSVAVAVEQPEAVNAVVLDSPIAMEEQIRRFGFVLIGGADALLPEVDGDLLSETMIAQLRQPLLVFLHEEDAIASPETVEPLFKAAAGPKTEVRFGGLGHAASQFVDTDTYLYYLDTFLTGAWSENNVNGVSSSSMMDGQTP